MKYLFFCLLICAKLNAQLIIGLNGGLHTTYSSDIDNVKFFFPEPKPMMFYNGGMFLGFKKNNFLVKVGLGYLKRGFNTGTNSNSFPLLTIENKGKQTMSYLEVPLILQHTVKKIHLIYGGVYEKFSTSNAPLLFKNRVMSPISYQVAFSDFINKQPQFYGLLGIGKDFKLSRGIFFIDILYEYGFTDGIKSETIISFKQRFRTTKLNTGFYIPVTSHITKKY